MSLRRTTGTACSELRERFAAFGRRDLYISHATNGIKFTQLERQHLKRIIYEGHEKPFPRR